MGVIKMKFNLNLQTSFWRGDRKFTSAKSSVSDSSSKNFPDILLQKNQAGKLLGYPMHKELFRRL